MGVRRPAWPIYDIFETADGEQVFVGVVTDTQWRLFCEAFRAARVGGRPDAGDAGRARGGARPHAAGGGGGVPALHQGRR